MQHSNVLKHLRDLLRHQADTVDPDSFSGPSLNDQEPELAHECARLGTSVHTDMTGERSSR